MLVPFGALIVAYSEAPARCRANMAHVTQYNSQVGVRAPAWMIALATATVGYQIKS